MAASFYGEGHLKLRGMSYFMLRVWHALTFGDMHAARPFAMGIRRHWVCRLA